MTAPAVPEPPHWGGLALPRDEAPPPSGASSEINGTPPDELAKFAS
jgi:hypothetical protein